MRMHSQLAAISLVFFLQFFGYGIAEGFLSFYASEFLSVFEISAAIFAVYGAFALSALFAGRIVEQHGAVRCIRIGALAYAPLPFVLALSESFWLILAASVLVGLGAGLLWNGGKTFVLRLSNRHGEHYGVFNGFGRFGSAMAGLIGGWLSLGFVFRDIFLAGGFVVLAAVALTFLLVDRNDVRTRYSMRDQLALFRHPALARLAAVGFIGSLFGGVSSPLTPLVIKSMGGTGFDVGFVSFMSLALGAIVMVLMGKASDSIGRKPVLYASLLVAALSSLILYAATDYWMVLLAVMLYAVCWAASLVSAAAAIGDMFREKLSLALVVFSFTTTVGVSCGAFLAGMLSVDGLRVPFLALGIILLFSPLVVRQVHIR